MTFRDHLPLTLSSPYSFLPSPHFLASWTWLYSPVPQVSPAVNGSHFCLGLCMVGFRIGLVGRLHLQQELTPCWLPDSDPSQKGLLLVPPSLAAFSAIFWLHHANTLASCCSRPSPGQGQGYSTMGVLPAMDLIMECLLLAAEGCFPQSQGGGPHSAAENTDSSFYAKSQIAPCICMRKCPGAGILLYLSPSPPLLEQRMNQEWSWDVPEGGKLYLRQEPV